MRVMVYYEYWFYMVVWMFSIIVNIIVVFVSIDLFSGVLVFEVGGVYCWVMLLDLGFWRN